MPRAGKVRYVNPNIYVCVCACELHAYTYIIHLSVYARIGQRYVCVHQCAMGDGSAVCARVGGLVLRARPEPLTLNRASPCPSAWTACGFGAQAFNSASAFNADIASWNVLRVTTYTDAFAGIGLADCIKRGVYDNWGSTLQTAYPTWSSLPVCTPAPTSTPSTATPRYAILLGPSRHGRAMHLDALMDEWGASRRQAECVSAWCSTAVPSTATPSTAVPSTATPSTPTPSTGTPRYSLALDHGDVRCDTMVRNALGRGA